jgi:hypothetical protein
MYNQGLRICNTQDSIEYTFTLSTFNHELSSRCQRTRSTSLSIALITPLRMHISKGVRKHSTPKRRLPRYFKSFEDWEQDLLTIDELPF